MILEYIKKCGYDIGNLKSFIYLLKKDSTKFKYNLDASDETNSYITDIISNDIKRLNVDSASYNSSSSFSSSFSFNSSIQVVINEVKGFQFDEILNKIKDFYYIIFETKSNDRFVLSVEFACENTYVKRITENSNLLELTFSVSHNIPTLQIASNVKLVETEIINADVCEYSIFTIKELKMCNMSDIFISDDEIIISEKDDLKKIDFIPNTVTYNETYSNHTFNYSISFRIPLTNYTNYLNYTLLEFTQNVYTCFIQSTLDNVTIITNLFPSYTIETSESEDILNSITITLISNSNNELTIEKTEDEIDDIIDEPQNKTFWKPVNQYNECLYFNTTVYLLLAEYNFKGEKTGNYACLKGYKEYFQSRYNIVEEYEIGEMKYGFKLYFDSDCSYYQECKIANLPSIIELEYQDLYYFDVTSECHWTYELDNTEAFVVSPNEGQGDVEMSIGYISTSRLEYGNLTFTFENGEKQKVLLIGRGCSIENMPVSPIDLNGYLTKTISSIKSDCAFTIKVRDEDLFRVTPTSGVGELDLLIEYIGPLESNSTIMTITFENGREEEIIINYNYMLLTQYIKEGEICSDYELIENGKCETWIELPYNELIADTYISDEDGTKYKKLQLYVKIDCLGEWIPQETYKKGDLIN